MKKLIFGMALIGMGSFAMAQQGQPTPQQRAERQAKRVEMQKQNEAKRAQHLAEMEKELGLDKTQVAQIKAGVVHAFAVVGTDDCAIAEQVLVLSSL